MFASCLVGMLMSSHYGLRWVLGSSLYLCLHVSSTLLASECQTLVCAMMWSTSSWRRPRRPPPARDLPPLCSNHSSNTILHITLHRKTLA